MRWTADLLHTPKMASQQTKISNSKRARRCMLFAFTDQGIALNTFRAQDALLQDTQCNPEDALLSWALEYKAN